MNDLDLIGLSARNRRVLALGVHGADGDDPLDVAALLARAAAVADLADDDLAVLEDDLIAAAQLLLAEPTQETLAQAQEIAAAVDVIRTAAADRIAEAERVNAEAADLLAQLAGGDPEVDPEGEPEAEPAAAEADPAGDPEPEVEPEVNPVVEIEPEAQPIAASAPAPLPVATRVVARRPDIVRPRPAPRVTTPALALRASANVPGVGAGQALDTPERIMDTFDRALRATGANYHGPRVEIPLISLGAFQPEEIYGPERMLGRDSIVNEQRIEAVSNPQALRASGGICAPRPVDWTLPVIGVDDRPVMSAMTSFGVPRGGIRLLGPPSLVDVDGAVDVWTNANDTTPTDPVTKPCITLDCPDETEELVAAITQCLKVGNFRQRFFPEQVEAWLRLVAVSAARFAENRLIQKIGDDSTQVDVTQVLGTTRTILAALDRAGASMRSHHRLGASAPLRFLGPSWLLNNMISDLAREVPGATDERLATSEAQIQAFIASRHINASWFHDGEAGQIFGAQADGPLNGWPTNVICYLYLEGTWLHLDAGSMDFGIVRDSILNGTNDFQMFSEFFEGAAFHGTPGTSLRLDIDICADGTTSAPAELTGVCDGS